MKHTTFSFGMMPRLMLLTVILLVTGVMSMSATDYGFWVGSVKVTSDNCDNITGKSIVYGYISYSPSRNTLTITGAKIAGSGSGGDVIHNQSCTGLKVVLSGVNDFSAKDIEAFNCEVSTNIVVENGETNIVTSNNSKPTILIQKSAVCKIEVNKGASLYINSAGYGAEGKGTGILYLYGGYIYMKGDKGAVVNMRTLNVYEKELYDWDSGEIIDYNCDIELGRPASAQYNILMNVENMNYTGYEDVQPYNPVIISPTPLCKFDSELKTICDASSSPVYSANIKFTCDYGAILNSHYFPDAKFRECIKKNVGSEIVFSKAKIESVKEMDVSMKGISSLDGIMYFTKLERLYCYLNNLTKFNYSLPNLTHLDINTNKLTTLPAARMPKLTSLICAQNQITGDFTIPQGLRELNCSDNKLTSLTPGGFSMSLVTLYCGGNDYTSLDFQTYPYLKELDCNGCPNLQILFFKGNNNLKEVSIYNAPALEDVRFTNCGLESIYLWSDKLNHLEFNNCHITSYDLANTPNLTYLKIKDCPITGLDFTKATKIKQLVMSNCGIKTLDVTPLTKLEKLDCSNNSLTSLIMPNSSNLSRVSCYKNNIKGSAMSDLIESLPDRRNLSTGTIVVHNSRDEGNVCTKRNIDDASLKNWNTYKCEILNNNEVLIEYYGDYIKGDLNSDGEVNTTDVTTLYNVIFGTDTDTSETTCDINSDGGVNTTDVTELYNIIFGTALPEEKTENLTFNVNGVTFTMVAVDGGTFQMGSTSGDSDEQPVHSVTLSDYYIGETEVTQELWKAVMGSNPSSFISDKLPVESVSWNDCQTFITKLNEMTGRKFRLPTEAEWEFAARGGTKKTGYIYSGSNNIDDVAWCSGNSYGKGTQNVATKAPNDLGIYDMSGNVREWCQDWYGPYSSTTQTNPTGPTSGSTRVCRGGSWSISAGSCNVLFRTKFAPSLNYNELGLRLVLSDQHANTTLNVGDVAFTMIAVDGGTFQMGSTSGKSDEQPVHSVTLSDYYIGETEVTQALWQAVMGSNPSQFSGPQHPVEQVSWNDCQTFISKLNELTGRKFRLPTEAEWEFAARGGTQSNDYTYSGSNSIDDVAWYNENSYNKGSSDPDYGTHDVASKAANKLGIFDMSGNVFEWCQDWYGSYSSTAQTNPTGPASASGRVCRGGSWNYNARCCRVSFRSYEIPRLSGNRLGLRLAL